VEHEPEQASVVPVVVSRDGVDRLSVAPVGEVELAAVVVGVAGRVDDIARDHHEVRVLTDLQEGRHDCELRSVALAGIAEDEKRGTVVREIGCDREVSRRLGHPGASLVVRGIVELRELLVSGLATR
jgi:hypothetical protein